MAFPYLPFRDVQTAPGSYFAASAVITRLDELGRDPQHTFVLETSQERYARNLHCYVVVNGAEHEMLRDEGIQYSPSSTGLGLWTWTSIPPLASKAGYYFRYTWQRPLYGFTRATLGDSKNQFEVEPTGSGYGVIYFPLQGAAPIDGISFPPIQLSVIKGMRIPDIVVQSLNLNSVLRVHRVEFVNIVGTPNDNSLFQFANLPQAATDPVPSTTTGYPLQFGEKLQFQITYGQQANQPGTKTCYVSMIIVDNQGFRTEHIKIDLRDPPP